MTEETITASTITSTTSNTRSNFRDLDELEGTILVPDARPVDNNNAGNSASHHADTCVVATALPTTYFQYENSNHSGSHGSNSNSGMNYQPVTPLLVEMDGDVNNNNNGVSLPEAPVIPTYNQQHALKNSARDRHLLAVGEKKGKIDNEQQREDIQRANQKVASIGYFARKQVEEANRLARSLNRKEEANQLQTAAAMAERTTNEEKSTSTERKKEPEYFDGTFGKEYEVSKYEVDEYATNDYQISEYKSVYD